MPPSGLALHRQSSRRSAIGGYLRVRPPRTIALIVVHDRSSDAVPSQKKKTGRAIQLGSCERSHAMRVFALRASIPYRVGRCAP